MPERCKWKVDVLRYSIVLVALAAYGCAPVANNPIPGPDKQAVGTWYGAATGAVGGAVTGFNYTAATGPGAAVGAGLGALMGMMSGLGQDAVEESQLKRQSMTSSLQREVYVQRLLTEHYKKRLELHSARDIFPADIFFSGDSSELKCQAAPLVAGLARLTKDRKPWSRVIIGSYVTSGSADPVYAKLLAKRRAEELGVRFVQHGINARRVATRPIITKEPIVIDPLDHPGRYNQAIELIVEN